MPLYKPIVLGGKVLVTKHFAAIVSGNQYLSQESF